MQLRYHHVSRSTPNLERLIRFYTALGCSLEKRVQDDEQRLERAVLSVPGSDAFLQFIERQGVAASPPGLDWPDHMAFHTDDLEAALRVTLEAGATLERAAYHTPGGTLVAFVKDPDGHRIELVEKR